jgi:hypothetical protein
VLDGRKLAKLGKLLLEGSDKRVSCQEVLRTEYRCPSPFLVENLVGPVVDCRTELKLLERSEDALDEEGMSF